MISYDNICTTGANSSTRNQWAPRVEGFGDPDGRGRGEGGEQCSTRARKERLGSHPRPLALSHSTKLCSFLLEQLQLLALSMSLVRPSRFLVRSYRKRKRARESSRLLNTLWSMLDDAENRRQTEDLLLSHGQGARCSWCYKFTINPIPVRRVWRCACAFRVCSLQCALNEGMHYRSLLAEIAEDEAMLSKRGRI